jgi:hypothetical protein
MVLIGRSERSAARNLLRSAGQIFSFVLVTRAVCC